MPRPSVAVVRLGGGGGVAPSAAMHSGEQAGDHLYTQKPRDDPRYGSRRWKRARAAVLKRDRVCRIVLGCSRPADVADHIIPVFVGMSDVLFFGLGNLRAACQDHNRIRSIADRDARDQATPRALMSGDYS